MTHVDGPGDTSARAAVAQLDALRRMGAGGRLRAGLRFSRAMIARSRAALRERHPEADERTLLLLWIAQSYGAGLARAVESRLGESSWTSATTSS